MGWVRNRRVDNVVVVPRVFRKRGSEVWRVPLRSIPRTVLLVVLLLSAVVLRASSAPLDAFLVSESRCGDAGDAGADDLP